MVLHNASLFSYKCLFYWLISVCRCPLTSNKLLYCCLHMLTVRRKGSIVTFKRVCIIFEYLNEWAKCSLTVISYSTLVNPWDVFMCTKKWSNSTYCCTWRVLIKKRKPINLLGIWTLKSLMFRLPSLLCLVRDTKTLYCHMDKKKIKKNTVSVIVFSFCERRSLNVTVCNHGNSNNYITSTHAALSTAAHYGSQKRGRLNKRVVSLACHRRHSWLPPGCAMESCM